MPKIARFCFAFIFLISTGIAVEEEMTIDLNSGSISGKSPLFTFRSITDQDPPTILKLVGKCDFKEGLPASPRSWANTLLKRQKEEKTPYSALIVEDINTRTIAAVLGLGRMDPFKVWHQDIIDTYIEFGIIQYTDDGDALEYTGDQGLGTLCPIIPSSLGEEQTRDIFKIGVKAFRFLKESGQLLPIEGKEPAYIIGLFHSGDPLVPHLKAIGFETLEKEGFCEYAGDASSIMTYLRL